MEECSTESSFRLTQRMTTMSGIFLMIRRPPKSTLDRSSAASDVYKRQGTLRLDVKGPAEVTAGMITCDVGTRVINSDHHILSLIHISEPTRPY